MPKKTRRVRQLRLVLPAIASLGLSACGGSATQYDDSRFHFVFSQPSGWSAPKTGTLVTANQYVLNFDHPVGMRITVGPRFPINLTFPNGKLIDGGRSKRNFKACHDASFRPSICRYFHVTVSGFPGIQDIQATSLSGTRVFHDFIVFNSNRFNYGLELVQPKIAPATARKFKQLAASFRIGKQG